MKIGILTQPLQNNYGGLLQNYALQQVLMRMGHDVETIDQGGLLFSAFHKFMALQLKRIKHILNRNSDVLKYEPTKEEWSIIRKNTNDFIDKYINRTFVVHHADKFKQLAQQNKYDAFVVGSDQCWRPRYNPFLPAMFLNFVREEKAIVRIAYAASFGTEEWEMDSSMTSLCSSLVRLFDLVTVREDSGIKLCREYLGVDAEHVLDPTLLLTREDYMQLLEEKKQKVVSEPLLFCHILDPTEEKKEVIKKMAKNRGLRTFQVLPKCQAEILTKSQVKNSIMDCVYPKVEDWLQAFVNAEYVIVDSFHGMVFSIIFNKPFVVLGNNRRGMSRFTSLLKMLNLEDRLIRAEDMLAGGFQENPIEWKKVNEIIANQRDHCKSLLYKYLNRQ